MARIRPLFTGQKTYRARRLGDAARLLPGFGVILFLLPLLIRPADPAIAFLYVFGVWAVLILGVALMSKGLTQINTADEPGASDGDDRPPPAGEAGDTGDTAP